MNRTSCITITVAVVLSLAVGSPSAQALSEASRFASRSTLGLPYAKLVELGVFDRVTTFTTSDFGRTLASNGKGSNRGWGDHHIIIGGAINGAQI